MNHPVITSYWVSERNQVIAMWLIDKFEIQQGYSLAYYLKVPICNDNYTAICLWVQRQSQAVPKKYNTVGELAAAFLDLLPQHVFR